MYIRLLFLLLLAGVVSCNAPRETVQVDPSPKVKLHLTGPAHFDDWMHSPLRAGDQVPVTFSLDARVGAALDRVELYCYEYELYRNDAGLPSQRRRIGGLWGKLRTFKYADRPNTKRIDLEHRHGLGFPAHTRVEYVWRIVDVDGSVSDRLARFDAGTSPWPEDKVLLYSATRAPMADVIDIGFFRDVDYRDDKARFYADAEAMIKEGFFGQPVIGERRQHWAFYATDRSADGKAIAADVTNEALLPQFLKDFSIPGIDAFCLLHRENYTDRSLLLENFHSLSNNLFSAEAHNWGTAVHECGHAIFHLSDEYGGCACFQTHASSNVFRQRADCASWNVANGFPADDCYELRDLYDRPWYSAEEPTFFSSQVACQEFNESQGISADSCRTFIDKEGKELYWAFESTCIMHDDGDDRVRPFQRACRQVITSFYDRLSTPTYDIAQASQENIYDYEPVVEMEMRRQDNLWTLVVGEARMGLPTPSSSSGGEIVMRVVDENGLSVADYRLAQPNAVHVHAHDGDRFEVPTTGSVRVAVPLREDIARVVCEQDNDAHARSADATAPAYRAPFLFDVQADIRAAKARFATSQQR